MDKKSRKKYKKNRFLQRLYLFSINKYNLIYKGFCRFIRIQKPITKILGPQFKRSNEIIDLDIIYKCNLRCKNCNRSLGQIQSHELMNIKQIKKFIKESQNHNIKWKWIKIVGGEPTLHPKILKILDLLLEYKKNYSFNTKLTLVTNGFGKKVNEVLSKIPKEIEIRNSYKKSSFHLFTPFNDAPKDYKKYKFADYSNGCDLLYKCGMALNPYGYYSCAHAAGIDQIFGFDLGKKKLPLNKDIMIDQIKVFCKLCGYFKPAKRIYKQKTSNSWKIAFEKYKKKKPKLSLY